MTSCLCSRFARPRPVAWLFFLAAFSLLMGLGIWQLQRLEWRRTLIADMHKAYESAPLKTLPTDPQALEALAFRSVKVTGHFLPEIEFHITPRYVNNTLGYHLYTPFVLKDGRTLIINRGWVPAAKKDPKTRPESLASAKEQTLRATVRVGADRIYFTPPSQPEKNIWFGRDIAMMAKHAKLSRVVPVTADLTGKQDTSVLPVPSVVTIELRNDHLQYAITWFLIALGVLTIFLVYHHKGKSTA